MSDCSDIRGIFASFLPRDLSPRALEKRSQCIHRARLSLSLADFKGRESSTMRARAYAPSPTRGDNKCRAGWLAVFLFSFFLPPGEHLTIQRVPLSCASDTVALWRSRRSIKSSPCATRRAASCNCDFVGFEVKLLQLLLHGTIASASQADETDLNSAESINFCFVRTAHTLYGYARPAAAYFTRRAHARHARAESRSGKSYSRETLLIWKCQSSDDFRNSSYGPFARSLARVRAHAIARCSFAGTIMIFRLVLV